ncbi:MAG: hypothetical protein VB133_07585 [Anaeromusa sp.]|uniref:hypothetical protein n=1 Tax=Anaeromusa sp. TaxID=1872520 RepID=UPI002B201FC1|nr:hypothetical protein [Anaeromusa sp.]MEA4834978.1 hypothetical protein [Anaeromusa sp.]
MTTEQVIRQHVLRILVLTEALTEIMELANKLPFQGSEDERLIFQLAQRALRGRPND